MAMRTAARAYSGVGSCGRHGAPQATGSQEQAQGRDQRVHEQPADERYVGDARGAADGAVEGQAVSAERDDPGQRVRVLDRVGHGQRGAERVRHQQRPLDAQSPQGAVEQAGLGERRARPAEACVGRAAGSVGRGRPSRAARSPGLLRPPPRCGRRRVAVARAGPVEGEHAVALGEPVEDGEGEVRRGAAQTVDEHDGAESEASDVGPRSTRCSRRPSTSTKRPGRRVLPLGAAGLPPREGAAGAQERRRRRSRRTGLQTASLHSSATASILATVLPVGRAPHARRSVPAPACRRAPRTPRLSPSDLQPQQQLAHVAVLAGQHLEPERLGELDHRRRWRPGRRR